MLPMLDPDGSEAGWVSHMDGPWKYGYKASFVLRRFLCRMRANNH